MPNTAIPPAFLPLANGEGRSDVLVGILDYAHATGLLPHRRSESFDLSVPTDSLAEELLPNGAEIIRTDGGRHGTEILAEGSRSAPYLILVSQSRVHVSVRIAAGTSELAEELLAEVEGHVPVAPEPAESNLLEVGFQFQVGGSFSTRWRHIDVPDWSEIKGNYTAGARGALDRLMSMKQPETSGRLILIHGAPGTGKSTALRALAREWRSWAKTVVVVDPENFFGDASYLMGSLMGREFDDPELWRLLVVEDADELLEAGAKRRAGQGLARLLNVTDGILGQGARTIVVLTTNESLTRLHPAIIRPGRCLAQIEVGPMNRVDAAQWLGSAEGIEGTGATLAELYDLRATTARIVANPDDAMTGYL